MNWQASFLTASTSAKAPIRFHPAPLSSKNFVQVWASHVSTLRILRSGSNFCDTFTQLENLILNTSDFTRLNLIISL